jgi:hypothetical protein
MKLICIGIGGTGAACIESVVHLAALGLYPDDWSIVPVVIDPDQQHPRIAGMTGFIHRYNGIRQAGAAKPDFSRPDLFGTPILRKVSLNTIRPAAQENLFGLLGLSNPIAPPLARLFFQQHELGTPDSREFANGYYGRANAGVCFFSDPVGQQQMMLALREHLKDRGAHVAIFGSVFGGTGAAGLLHVARTIRQDPELQAFRPRIAVVQLESYFEPDASGLNDTRQFVNLPETFQRRTGAAYQFLATLAENNNLPFDQIYLLGTPAPTIFPPDWFKRDQQDNPHLFLEYLAALGAYDFVLNQTDDSPVLKIRRIAESPFGEPLATLRHRLFSATATYSILTRLVIPAIRACAPGTVLPGHPWIHDIHAELSKTAGAGALDDFSARSLLEHFESTVVLLREILGHAGILDSSWRSDGQPAAADEVRERHERMSALTRDSFPDGFTPHFERFAPLEVLIDPDPTTLFDTFTHDSDAKLPVRALYRWASTALRVPQPETGRSDGPRPHQLVQQEGTTGSAGEVLSLPLVPDDTFKEVSPKEVLRKLARATWKSPPVTRSRARGSRPAFADLHDQDGSAPTRRDTSEYPSLWAPALVYRDLLFDPYASDRLKNIHLGLLWIALMKWNDHQAAPPVYDFDLGDVDPGASAGGRPKERGASVVSAGFRDAIRSTQTLPNYRAAVSSTNSIFALHRDVVMRSVPEEDSVLGFFYPDTVIVPAPGLSRANADMLCDIGRWASGTSFPKLLRDRFYHWTAALLRSGVPGAEVCGPQFVALLDNLDDTPHEDAELAPDLPHSHFPFDHGAPWIKHIYQEGA